MVWLFLHLEIIVVNKMQNYGSLLSVLSFFLWSSFSLSQEAMMILVLECGSRWIIVVEEYLPMAWHSVRLNQIAVIHGSAFSQRSIPSLFQIGASELN